jgi:hypothetical protein
MVHTSRFLMLFGKTKRIKEFSNDLGEKNVIRRLNLSN